MHLPTAPPVASPWTCPGCHNSEFSEMELRRLNEDGSSPGQHCSAKAATCAGQGAVTVKQRRKIGAVAQALDLSIPDFDRLSFDEAEMWIEEHNTKWMGLPPHPKLTKEQFEYWTQAGRD
jgi:pyruvate-formate lyase-activating enzyme